MFGPDSEPVALKRDVDVTLVPDGLQVTLHVDNLRGENSHHQAETAFKAFGRALRMAVARDSRLGETTPSTKGTL